MSDSVSTHVGVPVVEGLFTLDPEPRLIGGRRPNGTYAFPYGPAAGDPDLDTSEMERVLLSRRGRLWSWTDSQFAPPPPFIPLTEPYQPRAIAAVELPEGLIILGQVVDGVGVEDLSLGQEMELVLGALGAPDGERVLVWNWSPVRDEHSAGSSGQEA